MRLRLLFLSFAVFTLNAQEIILAPQAIPAEKTAAKELRSGLKKMFGIDVPIVSKKQCSPAIFVGQSKEIAKLAGVDFAKLRNDEIIVKSSAQGDVVLSGQRPRGTIYAVYEYLEKGYGVRWWTAKTSYFPKKEKYYQPELNIRYAPQFFFRELFYDRISRSFAVKLRSNGHWRRISQANGGHYYILGFAHTFVKILPSKKYADKHPEWYSKVKGKRTRGGQAAEQLCLTNKKMRKQFIVNVKKWLKENPGTRIVAISHNDNNNYCRCANCLAAVKKLGTRTDLLLDFVNEVAVELEKTHPKLLIRTLAYHHTRLAPKTIRPHKNIIVSLACSGCNFGYPLESKQNASFAKNLRGWEKMNPIMFVWNYYTFFSKYYQTHPNWCNITKDLQFFARNNVTGIFAQGSHGPTVAADFPEIRTWVIAKLLWNPHQDAFKLIDEFVSGYYGKAGPFIRRHIDLVTTEMGKYPKVKLGCTYGRNPGPVWLSDAKMAEAWQLLEDAQKTVADNPELLKRAEAAAVSFNFNVFERPSLFRKSGALAKVNPVKLIDKYTSIAKRENVKRLPKPLAAVTATFLSNFGVYRGDGKTPVVAGKRPCLAVSLTSATHYVKGTYVFIENDLKASIGKTTRLIGGHSLWSIQFFGAPKGVFDVYVEAYTPDNVSGEALKTGVYDFAAKKYIKKRRLDAKELKGNAYRMIKLFSAVPFKNSYFVYFAPVKSNKNLKNIYFDRIVLVKVK